MKRLYSTFSYRNSIILVVSVFILFFLVFSGLPSSSNPVISPTAVEANAEPAVTANPAPRGSVKRALAATSAAPFFVPVISATKVDSIFTDVDGDLKADPGDTLMYTITISNTGPDPATAVMFNDTIDINTTLVPGSVAASPIAVNDAYNTIGNVNISVPAPGVRTNDLNPNVVPSTNTAALIVTQVNATAVPGGGSATAATTNGSVTMNSDGGFTYTPNAGFSGPTDTFTYTLGNTTGKTDTATVTISIAGRIWFVNSAAGVNGDGRLATPFNVLTGATSADSVDAANDVIFLYSSATNYTGGMTLLMNEKFIGQGAGDTLLNITGFTAPSGTNLLPATGGARPTVTAAVNNITLATGNTIRGIRFETSAGAATALTGSSFGTLFVGEVEIVSTGPALNLTTGTLTGPSSVANFSGGLGVSGATGTAINLVSVAGAMSSLATGVANTTGIGINIVSSSANFNFANTAVSTTGGTGVNLGGAGTGNTGTITFAQLNITPNMNQRGLLAVDNTMTITLTSGTITTNGGTAVEISKSADPDTPLAIALTSVAGTGGTNGILLNNVSGSFTSGTTNLQSQTGIGLSVANSAAACDFNNTTVNSSGGTGVSLLTNIGTLTFDDLDITPDANQRGLLATNNTMLVTATSGTIATSGAVAVEMTRSSSATPLAMALTSVSASGGANGIVLTRTSGSFTVNGDGTNTTLGGNGTGGTIANVTGADGGVAGSGVYLDNATNVALRRMTINGTNQNFGIRGLSVVGFTLEYSTIGGTNGNNGGADEGSARFTELTGSAAITSCNISGGFEDNIAVVNTGGSLNRITISNTTIGANSTTDGSDGILIEGQNNAVVNTTVQNGTFTSTRGDHFQLNLIATASADLVFTGNTITNAHPAVVSGGGGIRLTGGSAGGNVTGTYNFSNNIMRDSNGTAIGVTKGAGSGSLNGTINNNQIGVAATLNSGSAAGSGISVITAEQGSSTVAITNNQVRQYNNFGIIVQAGGLPTIGLGTLNATVTGNTISNPGTAIFAKNGFQLNSGTLPGDAFQVCLTFGGAGALRNSLVGSGTDGGTDFRLRQRQSTTVRLPGYGGANNDDAAVVTFAQGNNNPSGTPTGSATNTVPTGGGWVGGAACATPPAALELEEPDVAAQAQMEDTRISESESQGSLRAARGEVKPDDLVQKLRQDELDWLIPAALERWRLAGITGEELARLQSVRFELADLPNGEIAKRTAEVVQIDELAAGYGWFVDLTFYEDNEFTVGVPGRELQTTETSLAHGKMDLLTVIMRELGREYLKEYLKDKKEMPESLRPLMEATLSPSVRRLPDASAIGFIIPEMPEIVIPPLANEASTQAAVVSATTSTTGAAITAQDAAGTLAPQSGETVSLTLGDLPAGESITIMFRATINALGTLPPGTTQVCNQGTVSGSNFSNVLTDDPDVAGANQPTCTALDVADLAVTKTDSPDPVIAGQNITYTITVTNNGPQAAASASLTDAIPANTTFVSVTTPAGWTRTDSVPVGGTGNITFTNPSVANAASAVFTLVVQVAAATPDATVISNTATVASTTPDTSPLNNTATATTTVTRRADLAVTKSDSPDPVQAGSNITYTIGFTNNGPNTGDNTTVTDAVPANTTFVSATVTTGSGWSTSAPAVGGTGNVVFSKASVANAETAVFTIVVQVNGTTANGTIITNSVTAASDTIDGVPGNNTATAMTTVTRMADLAVTKSDSPDPAFAGTNITYTIGFTNNGPNSADTVTVTDAVPTNTTFVSATVTTGTGWSTSAPAVGGTGNVIFSKALVANAETATFTIVVQINAATPNGTIITNTVTAASPTPDPTPGNNTAMTTTTANQQADLAVTKSDSPDPVFAGNNITYTIGLSNSGPGSASTVTVTDAVPANATFVSATVTTGTGWSTSAPAVGGTGNVVFSKASVANGETATFTIVVRVNSNTASGTVISNTATAASTTADPTPGNNSATATTTVATQADLAVTKTDSPDPVFAGNNITYTITVTNNGPSDAASAALSDAIPANTTFVSVTTPAGWTRTDSVVVGGTGTLTFTNPSVTAGASAVFTLVVNVASNIGSGTVVSNTATVTTTTTDPTPGNNSATATTTVNTAADLGVTKSDSPDPVVAGNNITYTISFTNAGPSDAQLVTVTDAVPANTTFVSATVTVGTGWSTSAPAVGATGNVVFSKATVVAAETATFTIVVKVNTGAANGSTISNTATAASVTTDPVPGNNSATATTTVQAQADLAVTKTDSPDPVFAGNNITYTIGFTNNGPSDAQSVTVTDAVPANATFVSATVTTGSGWSTSAPAVGGTGNVVFSKATVTAGETASFTIVVKVNANTAAATVISNTATAASTTTDPTPGNNSATATTTVQSQADLAITKTDSPDPVIAGNNLTYTVTLTNNGPSDATTVALTDAVPANTTFVSATVTVGSGWGTAAPAVGGTGNVIFSKATVVAGETATFTIVVNVNSGTTDGATITNTATATATSGDPTPGNNSATATTTVQRQANLSVTKTDAPDPVLAGQNITYTINFTNNGPSDADTVTVTDAVPANTTFVSATAPGSWTTSAPAVGGTGNIVFSKATVLASETASFTIVVKVNANTAAATVISNTATAASTTTDPTPGNNSATATTTVNTQSDIAVTKTDSPDPVFAGANLTYSIGFTNNGPSDAQTVTLTDAVPANTTFVSVTTPAGWTATTPAVGATGNVVFSRTTSPAGETASFTIVVKVNANTASGATIMNTVTGATTTTDPTPGNNSATTTTTVNTQADLAVTKTDSPDPVVASQNLTYTVTLTNNGPSDAQAVTVTDAVPANTTFVSATAPKNWTSSTPAVGGTGNIVFSKATVAAGEVAVFTIVVNVNTATPNNTIITNSATGATTTTDPTPGNNTGTATTTVIAQADLAVTKSDSPDPVCVNGNISYTINLTNNGPGPGINTTVTDAVPANTTFVSATVTTGTGWSTSAPAVGGTGNVVFSKANVANPETAVFTIVVNVNGGTAGATLISNTVTAASTIPDPVPANNTATAMTTVDPIAPTITCPANITAAITGVGSCAVVNYPAPVATDNCAVASVVCNPPSGSCFPVGTTTVNCTATDTAGNTASCSFTVTTFDICLQDDSNSGTVVLVNSLTGAYRFCCNGSVFTGVGTVKTRGSTVTLEAITAGRRVSAKVDKTTFVGTGYLQQPPGTTLCTITDRDTRNNSCICQ